MANQYEEMERQYYQQQNLGVYKLYVICYRESGGVKNEVVYRRAAVLVDINPPDVLSLRSGAIFEVEKTFASKEEAYRWWIKEEDQLTFPKSGRDITR